MTQNYRRIRVPGFVITAVVRRHKPHASFDSPSDWSPESKFSNEWRPHSIIYPRLIHLPTRVGDQLFWRNWKPLVGLCPQLLSIGSESADIAVVPPLSLRLDATFHRILQCRHAAGLDVSRQWQAVVNSLMTAGFPSKNNTLAVVCVRPVNNVGPWN